MTITKERLAQLEAMQQKPSLAPHLRPDGHVVEQVHSQIEAARKQEIGRIKNRLAYESHIMKDQLIKFRDGYAKAQFNGEVSKKNDQHIQP